ncbi:MAG: nodulation protein NodH, partial [Paracoccaceae bacterium]
RFQLKLLKALQISGQAAFYLTYEDITDVAVVNGLARYLGVDGEKKKSVNVTKKQNPQPLSEKVVNFEEMQASPVSVDYFALGQIPNFEPRRGAAIPSYVTAKHSPFLFLPIASGPTAAVSQWLADLDEVPETELGRKYTQKTLRQWMRNFRGHRSFSVVRHPVARLHDAFVRHILMQGPETYDSIRLILRMSYDLPIPEGGPDGDYNPDNHRKAFLSFANFVKGNINGQTAIRIDPSWATQVEVLRGFNQFILPDPVFREDDLQADLEHLVSRYNKSAPKISAIPVASPVSLDDIYDSEIEAAVKTAYQRDYLMFGFGQWKT